MPTQHIDYPDISIEEKPLKQETLSLLECPRCKEKVPALAAFQKDESCEPQEMCDACYGLYIHRCKDCERNFDIQNNDECKTSIGTYICEECAEDWYFCDNCGKLIYQDDISNYDDEIFCNYCFNESYTVCNECGNTIHNDEAYCYEGENYCDICYNDIRREEVEHVDYTIDKSLMTDKFPAGVEIECIVRHQNDLNDCLPSNVGITEDGSLNSDGIEIITPPASGKHFEKLIKNTCKGINNCNGGVDRSCGLHIHIQHQQENTIIHKTLMMYYAIENLLFKMVSCDRRGNDFCRSLKQKYRNFREIEKFDVSKIDLALYEYGSIKYHSKKMKNFLFNPAYLKKKRRYNKNEKIYVQEIKNYTNKAKHQKYQDIRYYFLNLHSVFYRGTAEIRLHQGTINPTKIINWFKLHRSILKYTHSNQFNIKKVKELNATKNVWKQFKKLKNLINLNNNTYEYYIGRIKDLNTDLCVE